MYTGATGKHIAAMVLRTHILINGRGIKQLSCFYINYYANHFIGSYLYYTISFTKHFCHCLRYKGQDRSTLR